jgi:hypothetical protein
MIILILCAGGLSIWGSIKIAEKGKGYIGLISLVIFTYVAESSLLLDSVLGRDAPALIGATENVLKYGTITPPNNALSYLQSYYLKYPGFFLLTAILNTVLGLTESECLVFLLSGIFAIVLPISIYTLVSKYYNSNVGLLSTFFFMSTSFYRISCFSRSSISIPLMLVIFLLLHSQFSKEYKRSNLILKDIILCALVLSHEFTSAILIIFILCLMIVEYICNYDSDTKPKARFTFAFIITLIAFLAYDIYYSNTVLKQYLPEVLNIEKTQLSTEVIVRGRTLRQMISLISRLIFWVSAGILILVHLGTAKKCVTRRHDISFTFFAFFLIMISLISGFLPPRLWTYAYICLFPVIAHIITDVNGCRKEHQTERILLKKIMVTILILSYFTSLISALPPLLLSPYSVPKEEYAIGEYRYMWSNMEIAGIRWLYYNYNATKSINIIGDLAAYLIASQYPLKITSSITQLNLATQGLLRVRNLLIIYRREMENILVASDGYLIPLYPVHRNLDYHYNLVHTNGEVSHYLDMS